MIDHSELLPEGREIGGFRIEKAIGHGNMGIIYRAIQINLNRPVALKVLFKSVAQDQDFVRSFFREAQAAAAFTHQNIVQAFDVGQSDDGIYYFAMELIEGGDISLQLKIRTTYEPVEALQKMLGVADGLDYGSTLRKLTHGDIKPANIMITKAGTFKLADLGLARMGGEIQGESDGIMLTPLYAAPEMINGSWEVGDPRADMYSLGATLYQMMYGQPPFNDDDYHKVIQMQLSHQHESLKDLISGFPSNISKLVDRFLEKDPDDRFENWGEAKHAMELALKDPTGSHTKKKKKVIHYHHHKDEDGDSEGSGSSHGHRSHSRKKKSSAAPVVFAIIALAVIAGLGYFALNMKKDVVGKEYKQLTERFEGKRPEAIIKMIESFVDRHGATPPAAAKDLEKYKDMIDSRSLFSVNDLSYQTSEIEKFEKQYRKRNPVVTENFRFNLGRIESGLNQNLDNNKLVLHFPFNNTHYNHANFYSPSKIKVNNGPLDYITAQVDKGVNFNGQSIVYGDIPTIRFSKSSQFTFSFWLNPKIETFPVLGKCEISGGQISRGYLFSLNDGHLLVELYADSQGGKLAVKTQSKLSISNWNHVVIQYNGSTPEVFINGLKESTDTLSENLNDDFACTGPFVIGFKNMQAVIDDVRIWNRTISDKELKELNGFRSITDLEKLTARYQDIKAKIRKANFNINSPNNEDDNEPDVGPKNNDGIDHPEYRNYVNALKRLKKNIGRWKAESAAAENFSSKIARDVQENTKSIRIFSENVRKANDEFYEFLRKSPQLEGLTLTAGAHKGQTISKVGSKGIMLKEQSERLGTISHRIYWEEFRSIDALNSIVGTMLDKGIFRAQTPGPYIYAMLIGNDVNYKRFEKTNSFPLLIKGLQRDLSQ